MNLQFGDYGRTMSFGLSRDEKQDHISKRPKCAKVLNAVNKIHPSAAAMNWWEARVVMRNPAASWREPEVLWRMHQDKQFLEDVAEQLLEVAKISEPIVDGLVRQHKE